MSAMTELMTGEELKRAARGRLILVAALLIGGLLAAIVLGALMDGPFPILVAVVAWIAAIANLLLFLWRQLRPNMPPEGEA